MATKKIIAHWSETGINAYCIIRRESDGFLLDDSDGSFGASPADPYLALSEDSVIKGLYEVSENRIAWSNGRFTVTILKQAGGSPAPASDTVIGSGEMWMVSDAEVAVDDPANFKADVSAVALEATAQSILTESQSHPTLAEIEASTVLAKQAKLDFVEKWILNKLVKVDNGDGTETWTLYDDDGSTVLKTWVYTTATTTRAAAT